MDFGTLDLTANAEAGFDLVIVDPLTKKSTDAVFRILGADSRAYRKAKNEAYRELARGDNVEADALSLRIYSPCIVGWSNVFKGDEEIKFSIENVKSMLSEFPWLMDQVGSAIETRANFTKPIAAD